jgi:hypothetical protein
VLKMALFIGCAAIALSAPNAIAQSKNQNTRTVAPWYERFTFGSEFDSGVNAWSPRGESKATVKLSPKSKWGVSFGVQEASPLPNDFRKAEARAGAYYDISKNIRVGGQVVLPEDALKIGKNKNNEKERGPGIKVESAFRF